MIGNSILFHLIDENRTEFYTNDQNHPWRELMIRVWYPADSDNVNMISDEQQHYPLLIFSHGLGGTFNGDSYATLCQACVNAGYIVVSLSHSYASKPVQLSDGRMTSYKLAEVAKRYASGDEIQEWCADIAYVLDQCCVWKNDSQSILYNRIDINKIGIIGHSFGGAAAVCMCRNDNRIKAAINLDGPLRGKDVHIPFDKPLLFILGSRLPYSISLLTHSVLTNDIAWSHALYSQEIFAINALIAGMTHDRYKIIIEGIRHTTFSDEIFMQQTPLDSVLIDPYMAQSIISSYIIDFFDFYLKEKEMVLLNQSVALYENVRIEKFIKC